MVIQQATEQSTVGVAASDVTWFAIETNGCKVAAEKKHTGAAPSSPDGYDY